MRWQRYTLGKSAAAGSSPRRVSWSLEWWCIGAKTWWFVGFSWSELAERIRSEDTLFGITFASVLVGQVVFGLVAWGLWRLACLRLGREPERRPS